MLQVGFQAAAINFTSGISLCEDSTNCSQAKHSSAEKFSDARHYLVVSLVFYVFYWAV